MKRLTKQQTVAHLKALQESDDLLPCFKNANQLAKFIQQVGQLESLVEEQDADHLSLALIYDVLYPGSKDTSRRTSFSAFRTHLRQAAESIGHEFVCVQPDLRGKDKHEIECHFEGRPLSPNRAIRDLVEASTAATLRFDHIIANPPFAALKSSELEELASRKVTRDEKDRIPIRFFVSYTRKDGARVVRLLEKLQVELAASKKYSFSFWKDHQIELGEGWHDQIQAALQESDMGLALVSPGFLSTNYIMENEFPELVTRPNPLVPVALGKISFGRHDLQGLDEKQIFRLEEQGKFRAFSECHGPVVDRFVATLAEKIESLAGRSVLLRAKATVMESLEDPQERERILKEFPHFFQQELDLQGAPAAGRLSKSSQVKLQRIDSAFQRFAKQNPLRNSVCPDAAAVLLNELDEIVDQESTEATNPYEKFRKRRDKAIDYLQGWLRQDAGSPFAAVFGEVGSGKTTMLQMLANEVSKDPEQPPVIFIDLRLYQAVEKFTLEVILEEYLRRFDPDDTLTVKDLIEAVQKERVLIIFDGLDEKIISMNERERHQFITELWRILPVEKIDRSPSEGRGHMIISCRSSYFPTIQAQNSAYVAQDREGVTTKDYIACVMLPWEKDQIEEYLGRVLGEGKVETALETIAQVHNLTDLSKRPYLLNLIAPELEGLQWEQASGKEVNAAALYDKFIDRWLLRDEGKHVFSKEHKKLLMEHLAADLWRDEAREWPWEQVSEWLDEFLYANPKIADRYARDGVSTETLFQDFRTATFFLRPDASDDGFRFAHTSLQEYFLAGHLIRSLITGVNAATNAFETAAPSNETLSFFEQMMRRLSPRRRKAFESHFSQMMSTPQTSVAARTNGLNTGFFTTTKGHRLIVACDSISLTDLKLSGWRFLGTRQRSIKFPKANFSNISLLRASFEWIDFAPGTDWGNADLRSSQFFQCDLGNTDLSAANAAGSFFRECSLPAGFPADDAAIRIQEKRESEEKSRPGEFETQVDQGHSSFVNSVAFAPNGKSLLSGSDDNTVRLWDASSGKCLRVFEGHSSSVASVAFAPDGKTLLSGSIDKTVRLWDASSGECLRVFEGHSSWVTSVAFAPDGGSIESYDSSGKRLCWQLDGKQVEEPSCDNSLDNRAYSFRIVGSSVLEFSKQGRLLSRSHALPNGQSFILHPWDAEEAAKPAHQCRWKLVSGPQDAWRYVIAINRETGETRGPEYCSENGQWKIT
ncbi:MAG: AAA family ATPase [Verrucomicrobiota bacterium]